MNDDKLILYYYSDGLSDRERFDIEQAIDSDPDVAERFDKLCRELNALADVESPALPRHTVERWHAVIDDAGRREHAAPRRNRHFFRPSSLAWGAALAAALVVAINLRPTGVAPPEVDAASTGTVSRGVQVHFRDTRAELEQLRTGSDDERIALVTRIIEQNRIHERAADRSGADDIARVLRAFEPVLLRMADSQTPPEDIEALRDKLAFELNVMLTKLARETSKRTETVSTGIQT